MNIGLPSGPIGHAGIAFILAYLFRLNPAVTVFCGILPDLVDKPLQAAGIGGGRYIAHSLLFVILVAAAFCLWRRKLGLAALVGGLSHLVLDLNGLVPWFYPFTDYNFDDSEFSFSEFLTTYFTFSKLGMELVILGLVVFAVILFLWIKQRYRKQQMSNKPEK